MKTSTLTVMLLSFLLLPGLYAQESNNLSIIQSPGSWDDGWSVGIQYEYQNKTIYVGPEIYVFPNLHNLDYTHIIGRIGFNVWRINLDLYHTIRTYVGWRGGLINRDGSWQHPMMGGEIGFQFTLKNNIYFTGAAVLDSKTDSKVWSNDDEHTVYSTICGIGYRF